MFTFRRPTDDEVRAYLLSLKDAPLSYAQVGCTRNSPGDKPPPGFNRD
ncbi:MAG: DUF1990 domain-containing protein, partial [Pirellulaceae bacterium]|nr:DUF1990 domain-containing protein [Pirellulaceae bacterium]